jgi:hypothetical protein
MGNSDSALVNIDSDACQFRQIIKNVQGIPSNSKSPSDTWILNLKNNVFYEHIPIQRAFIKMWPSQITHDIQEVVPERLKVNKKGLPVAIDRLEYERRVYRRVIRPLMDLGVCTNFIRYLASGVDCSYSDLESMLPRKYRPNMALNTMYMIQYHFTSAWYPRTRPSITDNVRGLEHEFGKEMAPEVVEDLKQTRYGFVVNTISPQSTSLIAMLDSLGEQELLLILFQVFAAIYAMELTLTNQNDLHLGNVMITNGEELNSYLYVIEGNMYTIRTKHFARVYDFDNAFSSQLGPNQEYVNFKSTRDVANIKHLFNRNRGKHALTTVFNINSSTQDSIQEVWELLGHQQPRPIEYVADFVKKYKPKKFVCSSTMFTPEGLLDTDRVMLERESINDTIKHFHE